LYTSILQNSLENYVYLHAGNVYNYTTALENFDYITNDSFQVSDDTIACSMLHIRMDARDFIAYGILIVLKCYVGGRIEDL